MTNTDFSTHIPDPAGPAGSLAGTVNAVKAVNAVTRIVATAGDDESGRLALANRLVLETRALVGASNAVLLAHDRESHRATREAGDGIADVALTAHPALQLIFEGGPGSLVLQAAEAAELSRALFADDARSTGTALLVPLPSVTPTHVLVVFHADPDALPAEAVAAIEALAAAGAAERARRHEAERAARHATDLQALTRAAKTLNESLDLATVLRRIAHEANRILDGDYAAVYRRTRDGAVIEAAAGMPPELIGFALEADHGLSGQVLTTGRSMVTNDYQSLPHRPTVSFFADLQACIAVPMRWGGELRGVLTVGYQRPFEATEGHLGLLEAFAELAAVACANASAHAGLALAARTDGLTGCLNHAALHETLRREIERAERAPDPQLSMIMIDLDDFKTVNEEHGHLVGDEVLRRAGHSLRQATRPYDVAARYGGDEFAVIAVDAGEVEAQEIARRAIDRITDAIGDLCEGSAGRATAGVAQWRPGLEPVELIANADRALLFGKHEEGRGRTVALSSVPEWFRPGRFARRIARPAGSAILAPSPSPTAVESPWPEDPRPNEKRLRDRALGLARAWAVGTELIGLIDEPALMLDTATHGTAAVLNAPASAMFEAGEDGGLEIIAATGEDARPELTRSLAARCLTEGRPLLEAGAAARARLAVPVPVADEVWGVMTFLGAKPQALDADDVRLAAALAEYVGTALAASQRHAAAILAVEERFRPRDLQR